MWMILLDKSGSMADPFSAVATGNVAGRKRESAAATKWEAAAQAVVDEAASLASNEELCLIVFDSIPQVMFEGHAGETARLRSTLDRVEPGGHTDIAAALLEARKYAELNHQTYVSVQVITDGLSDLERAQRAAFELSVLASLIDVILIDPTPDGEAVARVIAVRGRTTQVVSANEMQSETQAAAVRQQIEQARVAEVVREIDAERTAILARTPQRERLCFTASYPGRPEIDVWYPFLVYLHLQQLRDAVDARLRSQERQAGQRFNTATSEVWVNRGTWLKLTPQAEGVEFNPIFQEIAWYEDIQEVPFRLRVLAEAADTPKLGVVDVTANGVLVGQLPFALQVRGPDAETLLVGVSGSPPSDHWTVDTAHMFSSIFASYSRHDRDVVDRCAAIYRSLGMHVYIDREALTAGQEWHPELLKLIEQSDVFQLYWSEAASNARYVRDEWQHALGLRGWKGDRFIRPLYWKEPMQQRPAELDSINFAYLDLESIGSSPLPSQPTAIPETILEERETGVGHESSPEQERMRARSIPAAVIPLLPGESRESLAELRTDVAHAVAFLEHVTGLRYYPVPTLLVDEFTTQRVRHSLRVKDAPPESASDPLCQELLIWTDVVRALLLDLHVGNVRMRAETALHEHVIHELRRLAEWILKQWIDEYLGVSDDSPGAASSADRNNDAHPRLSVRVPEMLEGVLRTLRAAGKDKSKQQSTCELARWRVSLARSAEETWNAVREEDCIVNSNLVFTTDKRKFAAPTETFVQLLDCIRTRLAEALPSVEEATYSAPRAPQSGPFVVALAEIADSAARQLSSELESRQWIAGTFIGDMVANVVDPSWRRARDWFRQAGVANMHGDMDFQEFIEAYLSTMQELLEPDARVLAASEWQGGFPVQAAAWDRVQTLGLDIRVSERSSESDTVRLSGNMLQFVELFRECATRLVRLLGSVPEARARASRTELLPQIVEFSTHGIFVRGGAVAIDAGLVEWATEHGVLPHAVLPDTDRVLFCTASRDKLTQSRLSGAQRRMLSRCVLIHEHCHAAVACGLSRKGRRSSNVEEASTVAIHEALAAWAELYYVQRHAGSLGDLQDVAVVQAALAEYVGADSFDDWPYAGAVTIGRLYDSQGVEGVRELVRLLREDPTRAVTEFEGYNRQEASLT